MLSSVLSILGISDRMSIARAWAPMTAIPPSFAIDLCSWRVNFKLFSVDVQWSGLSSA
jgi:hypothetical protein